MTDPSAEAMRVAREIVNEWIRTDLRPRDFGRFLEEGIAAALDRVANAATAKERERAARLVCFGCRNEWPREWERHVNPQDAEWRLECDAWAILAAGQPDEQGRG